jgi:LemA protein
LFNTTTANYNVKLETFPTNIIAGLFGFKPSQFLETPEDEKGTPKVSFDF